MVRRWIVNHWSVAIVACLLAAGCSSGRPEHKQIEIGMSRGQVREVLNQLKADDFSDSMSVMAIEKDDDGTIRPVLPDAKLKEWMWSVPGYRVNLETKFEKDVLVLLNYWDTTKSQTRYHHLLEHASIERIVFKLESTDYEIDVIEVFPEQ